MKIFISWSGDLSKEVAEHMKVWLRKVLQGIGIFVSSVDIKQGDIWLIELLRELEISSVGILCLTKENINSNWVHFEAGALLKQVGKAKIFPLLIDLQKKEVKLPIGAFQSTLFEKNDLLKLVKSIANSLSWTSLTEKELEEQFNIWWNSIFNDFNEILRNDIYKNQKDGIQDLAEELFLPVIYKSVKLGEFENVFEWLRTAEVKLENYKTGKLGFIEASLARIAGKKKSQTNLLYLSKNNRLFKGEAMLELLLSYFVGGHKINDLEVDYLLIENSKESLKKSFYIVLGIWHLREKQMEKAKEYFLKSDPTRITKNNFDFYLAIPMGILCFAFAEVELGEAYFGITKNPILTNDGYPFVGLLSEFDIFFVNTCIGITTKIPDIKIRDFNGHVWMLIKLAEVISDNQLILISIVSMSKTWKKPLTIDILKNKLRDFQKRFIDIAGRNLAIS